MKFGFKIAAASMMAFALIGCQTTPKAPVDEPGTVSGFAHFDGEGSVSAKITDTTIQFYKGKKQTFTKDGECDNFVGASGVICYDRASNAFKRGGKKIGRFAPFPSNKPKAAASAKQAKTVTAPVEKPKADQPATADGAPAVMAKPAQ